MRMRERMQSVRRDETGAVAMLVSMVLGMGVVLGAGAISIDVGGLYAQRRQVQNGADAAALSLAQTCVKTGSCMAASAPALSTLAGQNGKTTLGDASNQPSYPNGICARNLPSTIRTDLPACNDSLGTFVDCPPMPNSLVGVAYVEAHTQTLVNGQHLLPPTVAQALGFGGANVQACARVAFGPAVPGAENTLPVGMSYCDWQSAVGYVDPTHPGIFQNPPKGAWPGYDTTVNPWPSTEVAVPTTKNDTATCPTWNGHTAPGGFSWLTQTGIGCSANINAGWVSGIPGNSYQCDLTPYYGKMVFIPIFDCVSATIVDPITSSTDCTTSAHGSTSTNYHISGYAAFYLSGWTFSGSTDGSIKPPNQPPACPGTGSSGRCVTGWFTQALIDNLSLAPTSSTTPNFGPEVVKPAG
jgi:Flp pilus assembly protein TadG